MSGAIEPPRRQGRQDRIERGGTKVSKCGGTGCVPPHSIRSWRPWRLGGFAVLFLSTATALAATAPVEFEIRPGRGIVTPAPDVRREAKPRVTEPMLESLAPIVLDSFRAQSEADVKQ